MRKDAENATGLEGLKRKMEPIMFVMTVFLKEG